MSYFDFNFCFFFIEVIISLYLGNKGSTINTRQQNITLNLTDPDLDQNVLCVFYGGSKLGAALFNTLTNKLGLFKDIPGKYLKNQLD